jgi:hypothetical protein
MHRDVRLALEDRHDEPRTSTEQFARDRKSQDAGADDGDIGPRGEGRPRGDGDQRWRSGWRRISEDRALGAGTAR